MAGTAVSAISADAGVGKYGVDVAAADTVDRTVESENVTDSPQTEEIQNEVNKTVGSINYETRYDLRLTYRGTILTISNGIVSWGGHRWLVDSHEKAGSYNGLQRYTLSAHRFSTYPADSAPAQNNA